MNYFHHYKMSLDYISSFAQWIEHFLNQGDEGKLRQVKEVYDKIKQVFGF